jgi:hypothetical protein
VVRECSPRISLIGTDETSGQWLEMVIRNIAQKSQKNLQEGMKNSKEGRDALFPGQPRWPEIKNRDESCVGWSLPGI